MRGQNAPNWAILGEQGEFCTGDAADGGVLGEFFAELLWDGLQWPDFFAEESLKALMVNVCMCARSPCGRLSSPGDKFRMQFPSRYFKL